MAVPAGQIGGILFPVALSEQPINAGLVVSLGPTINVSGGQEKAATHNKRAVFHDVPVGQIGSACIGELGINA